MDFGNPNAGADLRRKVEALHVLAKALRRQDAGVRLAGDNDIQRFAHAQIGDNL